MQVYLTTFLTDLIIFFVVFFVMYRAGESGLSNGFCTLLGISGSIGYVITSFISGKIICQGNCRRFLIISTVAATLICIIILFSKHFILDLILLFLFGMSNGFFFNAFQAFIRNSSSRGEIFKTVCMYTIAWSAGTSFGFLGSGSLYKLGPYALSIILVVCAALIIAILRKEQAIEQPKENGNYPFSSDLVYVWIGWITIFVATFIERSIQIFFPVICAKSGVSPFLAGLPLFLMMFVQGLLTLLFVKYKNLFYRKGLIIAVNISVIFVLLALWLFPNYLVYVFGFTLFGLYGSFVYFSSVLYVNNHFEKRSYNVGINESVVGIGAVLGVLSSFFWMRYIPGTNSIYLGCSLLLVIMIAIIFFLPAKTHVQPQG